MNKVMILQNLIYLISTLGVLMGMDLIFGAKITSSLNKILDKTVLDFDQVVSSVMSRFRTTVDTSINIDDKIIKTKTKMILGVLLVVISVGLIFFVKKG